MLWRKASRKWKAKGYTLTEIADKIEGQFGTPRKLGRSTIGVLVTTKQEEVPPDVLDFLEALPVLDEMKWADYQREIANEPADEASAAPAAVSEPEVAATLGGKLDQPDTKIDALMGKVDQSGAKLDTLTGKADQSDAKLDALTGKVDQSDAKIDTLTGKVVQSDGKIDALTGKVDQSDTKADALAGKMDSRFDRTDKKLDGLARAIWGAGGFIGLGLTFLALVQCQHTPSAPQVTLNLHAGASVAEEATKGGISWQWDGRLTPDVEEKMGEQKMGRPMPHSPLPGQAVKPCQGSEDMLYGACWRGTRYTAPCPPDNFQEGSRCYVPVRADPNLPVGGPQ